jgi:hypothetical protein
MFGKEQQQVVTLQCWWSWCPYGPQILKQRNDVVFWSSQLSSDCFGCALSAAEWEGSELAGWHRYSTRDARHQDIFGELESRFLIAW